VLVDAHVARGRDHRGGGVALEVGDLLGALIDQQGEDADLGMVVGDRGGDAL